MNQDELGLASAPHLSAALDEKAISHLHDVGLVNGVHALAAIVPGILEGIFRHSCTGIPCDDLDMGDTLSGCVGTLPLLHWQFCDALDISDAFNMCYMIHDDSMW